MKGVCNLSWIPLRAEPKSASEMVSSLLFGETYTVFQTLEDWLEIQTDFDSYKGFISKDQFFAFTNSDQVFCIINQPFVFPKSKDLPPILAAGSIIRGVEKLEINGQIVSVSQNQLSVKGNKDSICETARLFVGIPYLWGGRSYAGIDCSGFVQVVHKIHGINLPRDSRPQAAFCKEIDFQEITKGDLIFFGKTQEKITHVGIYLGDNKIIHASGCVKIDTLSSKGIHSHSGEVSHVFISAGRV